MAFNGTGSNVTSLNASNVASGTLAVARGGTGTASPSLVGGTNITISGTWPNQTVTAAAGAPSTAQVLSAYAGATAGAVGTYGLMYRNENGVIGAGGTASGSVLRFTNLNQNTNTGAQSGTWRCMGYSGAIDDGAAINTTVWLRIS
jgi:autotransporter family porin